MQGFGHDILRRLRLGHRVLATRTTAVAHGGESQIGGEHRLPMHADLALAGVNARRHLFTTAELGAACASAVGAAVIIPGEGRGELVALMQSVGSE